MAAGQTHEPVLLRETLARLAIRPDGLYVDATYGRGGHAREILSQLGPGGRLWLLDRDPGACAHARRTFGGDPRVTVVQDAFATLPERLAQAGLQRQVDGLLLDLGVSSAQLDSPERGFSFREDGPLDMRMSGDGRTAAQWLARAAEDEISSALSEFGEERYARRIARAIVETRVHTPLTHTRPLAQLIELTVPKAEARLHPATRSFQAIRIFVNRELEQLETLLGQVAALLEDEARLAVISFHSLEDRIVKRFLRAASQPPPVGRHRPPPPFEPVLEVFDLVRPAADEIDRNPRARSARLRSARRLPCAA